MCLTTVYHGKRKKAILDELPDKIRAGKSVSSWSGKYSSYNGFGEYKTGVNIASGGRILYTGLGIRKRTYQAGYHCWLEKEVGNIQVTVHKKDIVAVGRQRGRIVIVARKAWFPKPNVIDGYNSSLTST
jgi:hypothetical protein